MQKLWGKRMAFAKVNRFGCICSSEPHVGGWPWQILGAIHAVATVSEEAKILFVGFLCGK